MTMLKHINTLTQETEDGNIKICCELFYKERYYVNLLVTKEQLDDIELGYEINSKHKHIQKVINEST